MKLIGMLDSPYVRRVAIYLDQAGFAFEHQALSVFRDFEAFSAINPTVKAPTLVLDDGTVLMDSTLIIDYLESLRPAAQRSTLSAAAVRTLGLALAACEKAVQIVYEHKLRPEQKLHQPWVERVTGQLLAACTLLEKQLQDHGSANTPKTDQAAIMCAVAWSFIQLMVADVVKADAFPLLRDHAATLEATAVFKRYAML